MRDGDYLMDDPFIRAAVTGAAVGLGLCLAITVAVWAWNVLAAIVG